MGLLSTIGAASGRAFGLTRVGAAIRDAYFNLVTLLLPGNGTNGAQNNTFLDSSSNNFTITRNGNTTQGTFSPFSQTGWSVNLDGTGDYLTVADNAVLDMGSSSFTMEFWTYVTGTPSTYQAFISKRASTGVYGGVELYLTSGRTLNLQATLNGSSWGVDITTSSTINLNEWAHIAVVRNGNVWTVYINGTSGATTTVSGTVPDNSSAFTIGAGAADGGHNMVAAYISNFRVVKGTALYTANFTPSTTALTTTSQGATATEVELLTCQGNRFIDISDNAFTITVNGNPSVQAFSPFAPTAAYDVATVGGSGYFDGTGDYLNSTITAFGSGNFTIECWVYFTASVASKGIFHVATSSALPSAVSGIALASGSSGGWALYYNNGSQNTTTTLTAAQNTWIHLAVVKSGTTIRVYVDGVMNQSQTDTANYTSQVAAIGGFYSTAYLLTGYISGFKVTSTADYSGTSTTTANFTLPTAPPSPTSSILCCNFTNAGITDATAKNDLETVGNAQISTTQSKWGGSSIYFDGNGDYLKTATSPIFDFGKSDFTIEFWAYPTSFASASYPIYSATNGSKTDVLAFELNTSGVLGVYVTRAGGVAWSIISNGNIGTLTLNTWNHIAFVRNGSAWRGYVNGVAGSLSTTSSDTVETFNQLSIGAIINNTGWFAGYIDDFRITRFARYTSNFTAPTSAFPLQ